MLLFLIVVPISAQNIITQNFNADPFNGSSTTSTSWPKSNFNCQNPSYIVGPNFNFMCNSFPSLTGNGSFMILDNNGLSSGFVYVKSGLNLPAGDYTLSYRSASRFNSPGNTVPLTVEFGSNNSLFSASIPLNGPNWTNNQFSFTVPNGNTVGVFSIEQPNNEHHSRDYAIDEIVLTRLDGPCEIPEVTISIALDGDEYCFTANVANDPGISSYDFDWDFGDGSSATGQTACHTFTDGQYNVCVVVSAFNGSPQPCDQETVCRDICVINEEPPCECGIDGLETGINQVGCTAFLGFDATLNECTNFVGASVDWGDGAITPVTTLPGFATHTYTTPGTYFPAIIIDGTDGTNICDLKGFADPFTCGGRKMANPGNGNQAEALEVFPNPTSGILKVRHSIEPGSQVELMVTAVDGREVLHKDIAAVETELSLDLADLPSGLYNLKLRDKKGSTLNQKFVVE